MDLIVTALEVALPLSQRLRDLMLAAVCTVKYLSGVVSAPDPPLSGCLLCCCQRPWSTSDVISVLSLPAPLVRQQ